MGRPGLVANSSIKFIIGLLGTDITVSIKICSNILNACKLHYLCALSLNWFTYHFILDACVAFQVKRNVTLWEQVVCIVCML